MDSLVNININGKDHQVKAGLNVIEACRLVGVEIPHFCYHEYLPVAGSCRLCLVTTGTPARDRASGELLKNADGSPKIAWAPKPAIACGTKVSEGLHVVTENAEVDKCRRGVLEFILLNHPLDCPICDKAGECSLQEYAAKYGQSQSRYSENKNVKPKHQDLGGKIVLDNERCILCSRCIRIGKELAGKDVFGFTKRGSKNEIAVYNKEELDCDYILNVVDNCPVGALTEKAFRFKMRPWFLKMTPSISAESSAGVNTNIWTRENIIYRITPRNNEAVNKCYCHDSERYSFEKFSNKNRILRASLSGSDCDTNYAMRRSVEILGLGKVAIVFNAWQSLEEMFIVSKLAKNLNAKVFFSSHLRADDDGMLLSIDKTPNMRGAFVTGLLDAYPQGDFSELASYVRSGEIKTVLCFREDLFSKGFENSDLKLANIIYCGSLENSTSKLAQIAIPLTTEFEKSGLWVNRQFRIQEFSKALTAPADIILDSDLLFDLQRSFENNNFKTPTLDEIRTLMGKELPTLPKPFKMVKEGVLLDAGAFSGIKFPETNALNFTKNA